MSTQELEGRGSGPVARPLSVLVPLIKEDLARGDEAAREAGARWYRHAGEKMIEAKSQMARGEFGPWIKRHFKLSDSQARLYMGFARTTADRENSAQAPLSSLHQFRRERGERQTVYPRPWHHDVKEAAERARREAQRIEEAELTRRQEREAENKLALRLIEIGYKVLAKELHPDKGGSRDAMARLNKVRDRLKAAI